MTSPGSRRSVMSVTAFRASIVALLVASCATAGDGVGTAPDGFVIPLDDAGNPIVPDSGGSGTPDSGGSGTPDSGGSGTPDAAGSGTPDAAMPTMCTLV